ncbi:MAG TPA: GIY-YIG nuclease family protein [Firmicutes bacterium]|nr:GIY-YIG nuclease family protein [Bacillota bacterium]
MTWWVYILRCADGTLYTGATNDLDRRLAAHNAGRGAKYTRARRPVALVYREAAADKSAALQREAALKKLARAAKLRLIAGAERG